MAALHARGQLRIGEDFFPPQHHRQRVSSAALVGETTIGDRRRCSQPSTGRGWLTGRSQWILDPSDPFPTGFTLGDIWAPGVGSNAFGGIVKAVKRVQTARVLTPEGTVSRSVVVIGAGAVGLISAYHLAAEGADVTLVDARRTGRGAARGQRGLVRSGRVGARPGPGMISKSLKWMLRRDSPLYIRPSLDPTFVRSCSECGRARTLRPAGGFEAHLQLAHGTIRAYERLSR
jgi:hypothetical protein